MKSNFVQLIIIFIAGLIFSAANADDYSFTPDEIMPLSEVKPGMIGYGKTVFQGTEIERFDIEVVGIIQNYFPQKDIILIRCHHPVTDRAGVIQGMSGSPIYIDGKVIGALAYGFSSFPVDPLAGVTPIEYMLNIRERHEQTLRYRETNPPASPRSNWGQFASEFWSALAKRELPLDLTDLIPARPSNSLLPIKSPLMISGMPMAILSRFQGVFHELGFVPVAGGTTGGESMADVRLEPGAAVGAWLVSGDLTMAATGTVCYRADDRVYAFGHPFFGNGKIDLPMNQAEIISVIADQAGSFKMSNKSATVGAVLQDDTHGIYGRIGQKTPTIQTNIIMNVDGELFSNYHYDIIRNDDLTPVLLFLSILRSFTATGKMGGDRTLAMQATLTLENYEPIHIHERFSGESSEFYSAFLVLQAIGVLLNNSFIVPEVSAIDIELTAASQDNVAELTRVWYDRSYLTPGDSLEITLAFQPFRQDPITQKVSLTIPQNIDEKDLLMVQISSGPFIDQFDMMRTPARFQPQTMAQLIDMICRRRTNEYLYIRLLRQDKGAIIEGEEMPGLPPAMRQVLKSKQVNGPYDQLNDELIAEIILPVDYVINGSHSKGFRVKKNHSLK